YVRSPAAESDGGRGEFAECVDGGSGGAVRGGATEAGESAWCGWRGERWRVQEEAERFRFMRLLLGWKSAIAAIVALMAVVAGFAQNPPSTKPDQSQSPAGQTTTEPKGAPEPT